MGQKFRCGHDDNCSLLTSKSHEVGEKSINELLEKEILHGKEWQEI